MRQPQKMSILIFPQVRYDLTTLFYREFLSLKSRTNPRMPKAPVRMMETAFHIDTKSTTQRAPVHRGVSDGIRYANTRARTRPHGLTIIMAVRFFANGPQNQI